jgi:hypothetical protein
MTMGRIGMAMVIGSMIIGILLLTEAVFRGGESLDGETYSRNAHTFRRERTVCYTCHGSDAGSMGDYQAQSDRQDGFAMVWPR